MILRRRERSRSLDGRFDRIVDFKNKQNLNSAPRNVGVKLTFVVGNLAWEVG